MQKAIPILTFAVFLLAGSLCAAVGPKDQKKDERASGYSGQGVPTSPSKKAVTKSQTSQLPTQAPGGKKYAMPQAANAAPSSAAGTAASGKYSKQRPAYHAPSPTTSQVGAAGGSPLVQFPSNPSLAQPTNTGSPTKASGGKSKPAIVATRQPPVVFYPDAQKPRPSGSTAGNLGRPGATAAPNQPDLHGASQPQYYSALRPNYPAAGYRPSGPAEPMVDYRPTVVNNQTTNVIHNQTTNVANNVSNVNQWFNSGDWRNRVAINGQNWNGRPWWSTPDYGDWQHGHWHGRYYFRGRDSWGYVDSDGNEWLSGLVPWGLGNMVYRSGYQVYTNPYYMRPVLIGTTSIDYSRPICVQRSTYETLLANDAVRAQQLRAQALAYFLAARQAFYAGNTAVAYDNVNRAIALMPDDTTLHEFRALVLFSAGRYGEAAEVMHAVLAVAPGWDWTTLCGLYPNNDRYAEQLRSLEQYVRANPRQADARFLLAYHYITMGYPDQARNQLQAVGILLPGDRLSADLLRLVSSDAANRGADDAALVADIRPDDLRGRWQARRPQGAIELDLAQDDFRWDYPFADDHQILQGKYQLTQNLLLFATEDGSQMVGAVEMPDRNHFNFRLFGSSETDPGLQFVRR